MNNTDLDFIAQCAKIINEQNDWLGETDEIDEVEHRMTGPAGAAKYGTTDEIQDMREKLANGVVEFEFWKINKETNQHELRHAVGTTSEIAVPTADRVKAQPTYLQDVAKYEARSSYIIWYWDLEKNQTRCFNTNRFDNIANYTPVQTKISPTVTKVGNIYIHRDVDEGFATPETVAQINQTISNQFRPGGDIYQALASDPQINSAALVLPQEVKVELEGQEPVLRMVIAKNATEDDPPYQLAVNAVRAAVKDQYGVTIKRVVVEGEFIYA